MCDFFIAIKNVLIIYNFDYTCYNDIRSVMYTPIWAVNINYNSFGGTNEAN